MTVILRSPKQKGANFTSDSFYLEFDATVSERMVDEADVTSHPVEDGVDISDHIQPKQRQLSLTGIISNSPFDIYDQYPDRDQILYDFFRQMLEARELITVVTGLEVHSNMVLTRLSTTRDARTGQMLPLAADFVQVKLASQEVVTVPESVLADRAKKSGTSKKDAGRQTAEDIGELESESALTATGQPEIYGPPAPPSGPTTGGSGPAPEKTKSEDNRTTLKRIKDSLG